MSTTKVFISYCHEPTDTFYSEKVKKLSDQLRNYGIESTIDQYHPNPSQGWAKFMQWHIQDSDFVIVVFSPTYYKRAMGKEENGKGNGVKFESTLILNEIYLNDEAV